MATKKKATKKKGKKVGSTQPRMEDAVRRLKVTRALKDLRKARNPWGSIRYQERKGKLIDTDTGKAVDLSSPAMSSYPTEVQRYIKYKAGLKGHFGYGPAYDHPRRVSKEQREMYPEHQMPSRWVKYYDEKAKESERLKKELKAKKGAKGKAKNKKNSGSSPSANWPTTRKSGK